MRDRSSLIILQKPTVLHPPLRQLAATLTDRIVSVKLNEITHYGRWPL